MTEGRSLYVIQQDFPVKLLTNDLPNERKHCLSPRRNSRRMSAPDGG